MIFWQCVGTIASATKYSMVGESNHPRRQAFRDHHGGSWRKMYHSHGSPHGGVASATRPKALRCGSSLFHAYAVSLHTFSRRWSRSIRSSTECSPDRDTQLSRNTAHRLSTRILDLVCARSVCSDNCFSPCGQPA